MKLIVCLDENNGMAFHNRRQSMDCILREKIMELVRDNPFRMNEYSRKQFISMPDMTCVSEDFLDIAGANDYCFAETDDLTPYIAKANEVVIFRWNRSYPGDLYFPADMLTEDFQKVSASEFAGNSHETITQEVYKR